MAADQFDPVLSRLQTGYICNKIEFFSGQICQLFLFSHYGQNDIHIIHRRNAVLRDAFHNNGFFAISEPSCLHAFHRHLHFQVLRVRSSFHAFRKQRLHRQGSIFVNIAYIDGFCRDIGDVCQHGCIPLHGNGFRNRNGPFRIIRFCSGHGDLQRHGLFVQHDSSDGNALLADSDVFHRVPVFVHRHKVHADGAQLISNQLHIQRRTDRFHSVNH